MISKPRSLLDGRRIGNLCQCEVLIQLLRSSLMILAMDMSMELRIVHLIRESKENIDLYNGNVRRKLQENEAGPQTYQKAAFCTTHLSRPALSSEEKSTRRLTPPPLFEERQCRSGLRHRAHRQKRAITCRLSRVSRGVAPEVSSC